MLCTSTGQPCRSRRGAGGVADQADVTAITFIVFASAANHQFIGRDCREDFFVPAKCADLVMQFAKRHRVIKRALPFCPGLFLTG